MPTLPEILTQLQFISYEAALLGLLVTAGLILTTQDWRLLILALLGQYILVGLVLSRLVRPDIAVLTVLVGAFICPILFLSARQVAVSPVQLSAQLPQPSRYTGVLRNVLLGASRRQPASTGFVFRLFFALLLVLVAVQLSRSLPLVPLSPVVSISVYWLVLAGLGVLMLTEDPLKSGHGLLTLLTGFGLYYLVLEQSLLMIGLWGSFNILLALAVGYLIVVRGAGPGEEL
ncbi:MAG: hypothetical protein D6768_20660 [Chloroflexi bacterium]|nr:MAG: hypothetical protein D6768_20660 [Chloroflexota bacterium]